MQTDQVFDGTHELLCFTWNHLPPEFSICTITGLLTKLCPTLVTLRDLQAPLSMAFPRQEYWGRLPFSSAGDLPNRGIEPTCLVSLHWQAGSSTLELPAAAAAKSLQSCLTPCDPIDGSPPGSPVPGIIQARTLEWVAISFSNA